MTLSQKLFQATRWGAAILFVGMLTGAIAVLFPPLASVGVVALVAVVLLWALPELRLVPEKLLRNMFFMMVFVLLCIPAYFAIDTGVLPWISVRRVFALVVIILFSLTVAGSQAARAKILETVRANGLLALSAIGFFIMIFLSIFTSANWSFSLKEFFDVLLNWYVPLFVCILIVRSEEDVVLLLKIIAIAVIFDSFAGLIEFILERRFYFDIFPKSVLDSMLSSNPALAIIYYTSNFRNGLYRASSIYTVPLSFGELAAMAAPIGAYFVLHARKWTDFVLGVLTVLACLLALFCSGARGGYLAFLVAMPVMAIIWTIRYSVLNPRSLVGAIVLAVFSFGFVSLVGLIFAWQRLYNIVFGGGDTVASTEARFIQWNLAKPHILSNPVTGHGTGMSAEVIGYFTPGGTIPTVDSYVLSLLVEVGVPGLIFFFGMIACGVWIGLRQYLTNTDRWAALGGPIACSLIAFAVYRLALSQRENHTLFFLIIGLAFSIGRLGYERLAEKRRKPLHAHSGRPQYATLPSRHRY
jgi:O-antigen ligase